MCQQTDVSKMMVPLDPGLWPWTEHLAAFLSASCYLCHLLARKRTVVMVLLEMGLIRPARLNQNKRVVQS